MDYTSGPIGIVKCLRCGNTITYGRADKKFCCDYCKNMYHNEKNKEYVKIHSRVTRALDRNYKLLLSLIENGKTSVQMADMLQWGFLPEYITGLSKSRMKIDYRCYDITYNRSESKVYNIRKISDRF